MEVLCEFNVDLVSTYLTIENSINFLQAKS